MRLEMFFDVMCPWCWIGKRRVVAALDQYGTDRDVTVVWRSFELRPHQPTQPQGTLHQRMRADYGLSEQAATDLFDRIARLGADEGLRIDAAAAQPVNSFDAHRLIHLAADQGLAEQLIEYLFDAHLTRHANVADPTVLLDAATAAGMPADQAQACLSTDQYAHSVRSDEQRAHLLNITTIPTILLDEHRLTGAHSAREILQILHAAGND